MTREIKGKIGPIEGSYKRESTAPLVLNPCQHVIIHKERRIHSDLLIDLHPDNSGSSTLTRHEIENDS